MNNVFVYCEMEGKHVADVSLELLTKGRKLADELSCQLEAICAGSDLADVEKQVLPYRSEERRVGKECLRLCRSRWSPYH